MGLSWQQRPLGRNPSRQFESLVHRLRPSPDGVAAAAAVFDPGPLLRLEAERADRRKRVDQRSGGQDP